MSRVAVAIGIDAYELAAPLSGCESDACAISALLAHNHDRAPNFEVHTHLSSEEMLNRPRIRQIIRTLFERRELDVALFYFAGHGEFGPLGGQLVAQDGEPDDQGIPMAELIQLANLSDARERIIILDCCHAGAIDQQATSRIPLAEGVSILAASRADSAAVESGQRGLFTKRLCEALGGGAADVAGDVTIAATYDYIDQMFRHLEQRPLFKANISKLIPLCRAEPAIEIAALRRITAHFPHSDFIYPLDPSFEPTSLPHDEEHERIFGELQSYCSARLLKPVDTKHMYYAAMESRACQLTPLGRFYWERVKAGKL